MDNEIKSQPITAKEVLSAKYIYQSENIPLVAQFKHAAKNYQAYVINPDGSIGFTLDPWDGR